jgi:nucleotide-binding universal stress UspA family protein
MYKQILVPIDLADTDLAKPAIETAVSMARSSGGIVRLVNVLPMTPVMLAEYVPPDFDVQQRKSAEEAMKLIAQECELDSAHISGTVRQGGI